MVKEITPLLSFIAQRAQQQPCGIACFREPSLQRRLKLNLKRIGPSSAGAGILGLTPLPMGSKRCINQIDEYLPKGGIMAMIELDDLLEMAA